MRFTVYLFGNYVHYMLALVCMVYMSVCWLCVLIYGTKIFLGQKTLLNNNKFGANFSMHV